MNECPSFPGYFVSADGVVVSARRRRIPFALAQVRNRKGYLNVVVVTSTGIRPVGVHRMVADAFHGPPPFEGAQVRHLDGNPMNNCASNLAWGSAHDNAADRLRHGRYARGAQHPNARFTEEKVRQLIGLRERGEKVKDLAKRFSVSVATVEAILYGKLWKHVEFKRVKL
jgi:hypothetical protein